MRMDEGLDTGDMIMKREVALREDETGGPRCFERLSEAGAKLCVETMAAIEDGTAVYTPQDHEQATHTKKIYKEMGSIDWSRDAQTIECLIRGLDPWPSAYTRLNDRTLKIWKAKVIAGDSDMPPGSIVKADREGLLVQTGEGMLLLTEMRV